MTPARITGRQLNQLIVVSAFHFRVVIIRLAPGAALISCLGVDFLTSIVETRC